MQFANSRTTHACSPMTLARSHWETPSIGSASALYLSPTFRNIGAHSGKARIACWNGGSLPGTSNRRTILGLLFMPN